MFRMLLDDLVSQRVQRVFREFLEEQEQLTFGQLAYAFEGPLSYLNYFTEHEND